MRRASLIENDRSAAIRVQFARHSETAISQHDRGSQFVGLGSSRVSRKQVVCRGGVVGEPGGLTHERIVFFFCTDRCRIAVTRKDDRIVGKLEQPGLNDIAQRGEITIGEVGSADASLEEDIPSKNDVGYGFPDKHNVPQ